MTLTTHAVVGAGIATFFPEYRLLAFVLAFLSHFALDAIPHWDYKLRSWESDEANKLNDDIKITRNTLFDLVKVGIDALLGLVLALLLFGGFDAESAPLLIIGAIGGMLPDPLQFLYFKIRKEPLTSLQRFHQWIHAKSNLNDKPLLGVVAQVAVVMTAAVVANYFSVF